MENLPANPTSFSALSPQQQTEHRAKIGARVHAILSQFWRDDDTPEAIQALEIEGWIDVLENYSHSEIRQAWAQYQRTGPRTKTGKLYKPDAGALFVIISKSRPKPQPVRIDHFTPMRDKIERCSPEAANEILKAAGFRPKKFGGQK